MKTAKDIRKTSHKQEQRTAADIGGRLQCNSGATRHGGADVRERGKTRVECKYTGKNIYNLKLADLRKVWEQAVRGGLEMPVFKIGFQTEVQRVMDEVAVLRWSDFMAMCPEDWTIKIIADCFVVAAQYRVKHSESRMLPNTCIRLTFEASPLPLHYVVIPWSDYLRLRGE